MEYVADGADDSIKINFVIEERSAKQLFKTRGQPTHESAENSYSRKNMTRIYEADLFRCTTNGNTRGNFESFFVTIRNPVTKRTAALGIGTK